MCHSASGNGSNGGGGDGDVDTGGRLMRLGRTLITTGAGAAAAAMVFLPLRDISLRPAHSEITLASSVLNDAGGRVKRARPPRDLVDRSRFAIAVYKHGRAAEAEALARLTVAIASGALIGAERRAASASAGIRTLALVSMGAAVFTLTSLLSLTGDGARMGAAVCTGVGFLGAGVIHREGGRSRRHLVTAASVWISAALGVAAAAGLKFLTLLAALATVAIMRYEEVYRHVSRAYASTRAALLARFR